MSRQRVFSAAAMLSKSFGIQLGNHRTATSGLRPLSLFSTSTTNTNKKSAPNAEAQPHINDAKARPAEQGLRLDEHGKESNSSGSLAETEQELRAKLTSASTENATLLAKSREFEDKYLRALAESENIRSRLTKQIADAKIFAIQGFCKDLTEIHDILHLAIASVPTDKVKDDNKELKQLYEGLKMTDIQLVKVFNKHGLITINPIDKKFDPNEHEAVVMQEVAGKESGTVIFVSKFGYKLHDRVVRPAVVGVAK